MVDVKSPVTSRFGAVISLLNTHASVDALYMIVALAPSRVIPPPSACAESAAPSPNTIFLSLIVAL